ncbi:hypothetical protein GMMP15_140061 [Candidatus Magnetomoraceae bacterium gMMP-15]
MNHHCEEKLVVLINPICLTFPKKRDVVLKNGLQKFNSELNEKKFVLYIYLFIKRLIIIYSYIF